MQRFRALAGKEWAHHWVALAGLATLLAATTLVVLGGTADSEETTTVLSAVPVCLLGFVPLAAVFLAHRLVVLEVQGRTQRFLEALPLRRWEMVALKFTLGMLFLGAAATAMVLAAAVAALPSEPVGLRFLAILLGRALAYTGAVWSFCFLLGFMGRLRTPLYLGLFVFAGSLPMVTDLHPLDFPPLALVDPSTYPSERELMPWRAFWECLGLACLQAGLALGLSTLREGSVSEQLSRRMSQKEKVVVTVALMSAMAAFSVAHERVAKEPYAFLDAQVVASSRVPVEVSYLEEEYRGSAEELVATLEPTLDELRLALGWPELPPVRIALRPSLDHRTFESVGLEENDGLLVRANFADPQFDRTGFLALVVHQVLREATDGRALFEPRHWILDGFSRWWVDRKGPAALLRAVRATRDRPVAWEDLTAWELTCERQGLALAEGVAWSGLRVLEEERGPQAVEALARELFGRRAYPDARELLYEWRHPPSAVLEPAGAAPGALLASWNRRLGEWRSEPGVRRALEALPEGTGKVQVRAEGAVRHLDYSFRFSRPPGAGTACSLAYAELLPFDAPLDPEKLEREEHLWEGEGRFCLEGRFTRGQRVFVALEIEARALGCPLRLTSERLELR